MPFPSADSWSVRFWWDLAKSSLLQVLPFLNFCSNIQGVLTLKLPCKYWILTFVVKSRSKEIEADFSEEWTASWVQRLHSRQQATLPSWAHGTSSVVVAQWTVTQKTSVKLMFSLKATKFKNKSSLLFDNCLRYALTPLHKCWLSYLWVV